MNYLFSILLFFTLAVGFGQTTEKTCNQIPLAKPESKAVCELKLLQKNLQAGLSKTYLKGDFNASFKLIVDCKGFVTSVVYQNGNIETNDVPSFTKEIELSAWTPAKEKGETVTSTVFIQLKITNGKVEVTTF